ncbi:transcription termination/antitermination factor NusG [bacterium]|nr:transcription termination/antitermination factor NusG [bacterium]
MEKKWYIIHTYTGHEEKVKTGLKKMIEIKNLEEKIGEILIPTEEVIEIKKNKKQIKKRKFFPGYILIEMVIDDDTYWTTKNIMGVTAFLGGLNPIPLPKEEVENIIRLTTSTAESKPKPAILFEKDENVRIIEGPFTNFVGCVHEINQEKGKLRVMVSIFGRITPVELDFLQVEKI